MYVEIFDADDIIDGDLESAESSNDTPYHVRHNRYHVRNEIENDEFSDSDMHLSEFNLNPPEDSQGPENADSRSATPLQPVNEQVNLVDNVERAKIWMSCSSIP